MDCFVCQKHRGEIDVPGGVIYEDDLVYVSHQAMAEGQSTAYPGVLFVEPKRHAPGLADLTDAEAERIGLLTSRLAQALQANEEASPQPQPHPHPHSRPARETAATGTPVVSGNLGAGTASSG